MTKQWFVAMTKPGADTEAAKNLRAQGYPVYLPKGFRKPADTKKLEPVSFLRFDGYIFVAFDAAKEEHGPISNTRGVDELLVNGAGQPQALQPGIVERLRQVEDDDFARARSRKKLPPRVDLKPGDTVQVHRPDDAARHGKTGIFVGAVNGWAEVLFGLRIAKIAEVDLKLIEHKEKAA